MDIGIIQFASLLVKYVHIQGLCKYIVANTYVKIKHCILASAYICLQMVPIHFTWICVSREKLMVFTCVIVMEWMSSMVISI